MSEKEFNNKNIPQSDEIADQIARFFFNLYQNNPKLLNNLSGTQEVSLKKRRRDSSFKLTP